MRHSSQSKQWFKRTALAYLGTPYIWGGDDPSGFDCSGFVVECLKSAGFLEERDDYTAEGLFRLFGEGVVDKPQEGALLFFLTEDDRATHVTICLDENFHIGASGGGEATKDKRAAWKVNAFVKIRPIHFDSNRMRAVRIFG